MSRRFTLAARLYVLLGGSLVASAALSLYLVFEIGELDRSYRGILDRQVREQADARIMQVAFKKQVQEWKNILLRGAVAKDRDKYIAQFEEQRGVVLAAADSVQVRVSTTTLRQKLTEFRSSYATLDSAYTRALARFVAANGRNPFAVDSLVRGQDRAPTDLIDEMVDELQREVVSLVEAQEASVASQRQTLLIALLLLVLVLASVPVVLTRTIVHPIRRLEEATARIAQGDLRHEVTHRSADELGDLAESFRRMTQALRQLIGEIATGAQTVSATAVEVSEGAEQVNGTMLDVAQAAAAIAQSASIQTNGVTQALGNMQAVAGRARAIAADALQADQAARAVEARTAAGRAAAATALARLTEIDTAARETAPVLAELTAKSHQIRAFTDVVAGIASQSKLLALNAAIEAARAGDQGRGFGVVADEVGKLAKDSQEALARIRELVVEIEQTGERIGERVTRVQHAVAGGAEAFRGSDTALMAIHEDAQHSAAAAARIGAGTEAQQAESDRLEGAMQSVAAAAEQNAATAEEVSASNEEQAAAVQRITGGTRELAALATRLDGAARRFSL